MTVDELDRLILTRIPELRDSLGYNPVPALAEADRFSRIMRFGPVVLLMEMNDRADHRERRKIR